jgi:hypothetical protein
VPKRKAATRRKCPGPGCDAGDPTIAALTDSERASLPAFVLDHCKAQRLDPKAIARCMYCGVVFSQRDDFHLGHFLGTTSVILGFRKSEGWGDEMEWVRPDWLEKWMREHPEEP